MIQKKNNKINLSYANKTLDLPPGVFNALVVHPTFSSKQDDGEINYTLYCQAFLQRKTPVEELNLRIIEKSDCNELNRIVLDSKLNKQFPVKLLLPKQKVLDDDKEEEHRENIAIVKKLVHDKDITNLLAFSIQNFQLPGNDYYKRRWREPMRLYIVGIIAGVPTFLFLAYLYLSFFIYIEKTPLVINFIMTIGKENTQVR